MAIYAGLRHWHGVGGIVVNYLGTYLGKDNLRATYYVDL